MKGKDRDGRSEGEIEKESLSEDRAQQIAAAAERKGKVRVQ